jgi:hypothetical protein
MSDFFDSIFEFFIDVVLFIPRLLFWVVAEFAEWGLSLLPDLSHIDPMSYVNGFTGDLLFFLSLTHFGTGLSIVFGALTARFILRRVPFIG